MPTSFDWQKLKIISTCLILRAALELEDLKIKSKECENNKGESLTVCDSQTDPTWRTQAV